MDDTLESRVKVLTAFVEENKGQQTLLIDLRGRCDWTDFMIISTFSSVTHKRGLLKVVRRFAEEELGLVQRGRKKREDDEWEILDYQQVVINFMRRDAREFYDLEGLWGEKDKIFRPQISQPTDCLK